ncbi:anthranilate phosphoribosyltransferase [Ferrithrix thermotolerans DSM 19514]|uniref:Anthranilate phosphoribosyltransferase n=2 Tax=Ferrithrix TaxID=643949 RepID=A0A1M4UMH6_9ACTN|nr:anthranilate phosphoribosyltransferase [Ferrithrix thermotolerans DSM 19514]
MRLRSCIGSYFFVMETTDSSASGIVTWQTILSKLSDRKDLDKTEAQWAMEDMLAGRTSHTIMAAFLLGLRAKGESPLEMSSFATVMSRYKTEVVLGAAAVDTCGTGGDKRHTVNVSTGSAILVAGAGGKVCKHGGRASSSKSGSADILEALGVDIDMSPEVVARCVESAGIGFCFAPRYHPAMAHVAPVRRELKVPTVFNFLGPLVNPANTPYQLVGVSDPKMVDAVAQVLSSLGSKGSMVVFGADGLDEISLTSVSYVTEIVCNEGGFAEEKRYQLDPRDFGFKLCQIEDLVGGTPNENAAELIDVLEGRLQGPKLDILVLNAGAALYISKQSESIADGIEMAYESVRSGAALNALNDLVSISNEEVKTGT